MSFSTSCCTPGLRTCWSATSPFCRRRSRRRWVTRTPRRARMRESTFKAQTYKRQLQPLPMRIVSWAGNHKSCTADLESMAGNSVLMRVFTKAYGTLALITPFLHSEKFACFDQTCHLKFWFSRRAFWGFEHHFKDQADSLLQSLDASKQKMLQGEISNSTSSGSLDSASRARTNTGQRARSMSTDRSHSAAAYV